MQRWVVLLTSNTICKHLFAQWRYLVHITLARVLFSYRTMHFFLLLFLIFFFPFSNHAFLPPPFFNLFFSIFEPCISSTSFFFFSFFLFFFFPSFFFWRILCLFLLISFLVWPFLCRFWSASRQNVTSESSRPVMETFTKTRVWYPTKVVKLDDAWTIFV